MGSLQIRRVDHGGRSRTVAALAEYRLRFPKAGVSLCIKGLAECDRDGRALFLNAYQTGKELHLWIVIDDEEYISGFFVVEELSEIRKHRGILQYELVLKGVDSTYERRRVRPR